VSAVKSRLRFVREVIGDVEAVEVNKELCKDLILAVHFYVDLALSLGEDELPTVAGSGSSGAATTGESKSGENKTVPRSAQGRFEDAASAASNLRRGMMLLEVAVAEANKLIDEHRPQQARTRYARALNGARELLEKFSTAHVRLERAGQVLGIQHQRVQMDTAARLNEHLRTDIAQLHAQLDQDLAAQNDMQLQTKEQLQELLTAVRDIQQTQGEILQRLREPPQLSEAQIEELRQPIIILVEHRRELSAFARQGHQAPLPPRLDAAYLVESDQALPNSVGLSRGTYQGKSVLVKAFQNVNSSNPGARAEMQLHFIGQRQCEDNVVNIVAASHEGPMKLVLENAECTLHHLLMDQRRMLQSWRSEPDPELQQNLRALMLRLLKLMLHAVVGTASLHARRVYHRGLNPHALLVRTTDDGVGRALLSDFGFARASRGNAGTLSISGHGGPSETGFDPIETVKYKPPEVNIGNVGGEHANLVAADVYSLGAMLNTIIAGTEPFPGVRDGQQMYARAKSGDRTLRVPAHFDVPMASELLVDAHGHSRIDLAAQLQRLVKNCFVPWKDRISTATLEHGLQTSIAALEAGSAAPVPRTLAPAPVEKLVAFMRDELALGDRPAQEVATRVQELYTMLASTRHPLGPLWLASRIMLEHDKIEREAPRARERER